MNPKVFLGAMLIGLAFDAGATITPFLSAGSDCSGAGSATFTVGQTQQVTLCVTSDVESICGFTAQLQSANSAENGRFRIVNRVLSNTYSDPNAPSITYPVSITNPAQTTDFGGTVMFSTPPAPTTQLLATFTLDPQSTATNNSYVISTSPVSNVSVENSDCFGSPVGAGIGGASFTLSKPVVPNARLFGISTRMQVLTGNDVMIGGFIINGSGPKQVVVRARGPSLGVAGALADPTMTIVPAAGGANLVNDDWQADPNAAALQASGFAPGDPKESAILATLNPGAYTAIMSGVGNTTGIAIIEVYEMDHPEVPITGISTRGKVLTGNDVMIGGFIIQGSGPQTVAIRARGPSLAGAGIANPLADPQLTLVRASDGVAIASNDDWQSASNAAQIQSSGFAPGDPKESVILMSLQPGAYTAIVSGVGGGTGVGIVEVYSTQ